MRVLLALLGYLAAGVTAVWVGVFVLWIPGIEEIVHGAEASPVSGSQIGFGLLKSLIAGDVAIVIGFIACALITAWAFKEKPVSKMKAYRSR